MIDYFLNDYFTILAMKHKMENSSLEKIEFNYGNPFYLLNYLQNNNDDSFNINECKKCPQKLTWKNISLEGLNLDG